MHEYLCISARMNATEAKEYFQQHSRIRNFGDREDKFVPFWINRKDLI